MGEEIAISLKNISKCYKRYARPVDRLKEILLPGKSHAQEFWALRDINLEVPKGETVGIIGQNGSGKSTLLQVIAGTLTPTTGEVQVNGRVSALLELGSGFNPEFTGRQNVFFNGQILGLSREEIEAKFEEIAAFADIGDFMEQPVKTYSSGMFVRLAFAVAVSVNPDILIVDEALSVGDIFFQQKCYKFLEELRFNGASIIFVSHDTQAVLKLCEKAILMENGYLLYSGKASQIVSKYMELYYGKFPHLKTHAPKVSRQSSKEVEQKTNYSSQVNLVYPKEFQNDFPGVNRYGTHVGLIAGTSITDLDGQAESIFQVGEDMLLSVKLNPHNLDICPLNVGFQVKDRLGQIIIGSNTFLLSIDMENVEFGKPMICQFRINLPILPQQYTVNAAVANYDSAAEITYDWLDYIGTIQVISDALLEQIGFCFTDIDVMVKSEI
ncbi:MAG: ABC transporter ATP-binding protein [Stigonema ocellatum SAG 48.90 = DSM 106950]|nr:ABC transporter ATP-binding protein [Stigonema ocellatum SAG 48.90 = DSM 106950]